MTLLSRWLPLLRFRGSRGYWEDRYRMKGNAGAGSFGASARYKADVLNAFVHGHAVNSVIEFGCGDGSQLALAEYPTYLGFDISSAALARCRQRFCDDAKKRFALLEDYDGARVDLSLSLDVLYHLIEDETYFDYLDRLFAAAQLYAIVYSTSTTVPVKTLPHVRHRDVEGDIAQRFPMFRRMHDCESKLPPPVQQGRRLATRFLIYER